MQLHFLGANRQVTGSRYVLEAAGQRVMIDCGLFQERHFQQRNYDACPIAPASLDALLLTHAHLDHTGLVPKLVREGFGKPIYATAATIDLAELVLHDSAHIQEEDAAYKQERHAAEGRTARHGYQPLYTTADVEATTHLFRPVKYHEPLAIAPGLRVTWHDAGHILGSALLDIEVTEGGSTRHVVFSGDLGLWDKPLVRDPELLRRADVVIMESTYGDREHDRSVPIEDQLEPIVSDTVKRGGNVVVPTFAIERAQELLFHLGRLRRAGRVPHLMAFLDSPMAVDATDIFRRHRECLDAETMTMIEHDQSPFRFPGLVLCRTRQQSKAINNLTGSCVIMAGSGMCTGGRIKHHLVHHIERPTSTILFVGYQAEGTLGRQISEGRKEVRILGTVHPVRAHVAKLDGMSAHADRAALTRWIGAFAPMPDRLFLTHGEEGAALSLAEHLQKTHGLTASVPHYREVVDLG